MKYVIRSIKYNTYYKSKILKDMFHFVTDINEAKLFNKPNAVKLLKTFKRPDNYELIKQNI